MIPQIPALNLFKQQLRDSLIKETANSPSLTITKNSNVYNCGDSTEMVYFIEKGQVKLVMISSAGQECVLASRTDGDIFGEFSSQLGVCNETATATEDMVLKQIPSDKFLLRLATDQLLEGFVRYLAVYADEQQEAIANLVIADNEQKLGQILLQMARTKGQKDPSKLIIKLNISHEELSHMVGTTVPRINLFIQRFRNLGLIEMSQEDYFIIKEKKLIDYLAQIT